MINVLTFARYKSDKKICYQDSWSCNFSWCGKDHAFLERINERASVTSSSNSVWRCYVRHQMRRMKGSWYEVSKSADRRQTDKKEGGEGLGSILIWDPGSSEMEVGLGWICSYRSSDAIWRRCHWSPFINALQESMIFTTLWEITTPAVLIADFFVTFVSCKCKNIYHNI